MKLSFFLAKLFGIYSVILGLYWVTKQEKVHKFSKELFSSPALLTITGLTNISVGLLVLLIHPIFELDFTGVITILFGAFPLFRGLLRLFVIEKESEMSKKWTQGYRCITLGVFLLLIGTYLIYNGFADWA